MQMKNLVASVYNFQIIRRKKKHVPQSQTHSVCACQPRWLKSPTEYFMPIKSEFVNQSLEVNCTRDGNDYLHM